MQIRFFHSIATLLITTFMLSSLFAPLHVQAQTAANKAATSVNNSNKFHPISDATYDNAGDFYEGLAAVNINKKWGFIDTTGKIVIAPQFNPWQAQFNAYFSEGLVAINLKSAKTDNLAGNDPGGARWGFADKTGKIVIKPQFIANYYSPPHFKDGLAVVGGTFVGTTIATIGVRNKFGYINKAGNYVINPTFDEAYDFSDDMACVKIGDKYGFIDKSGKLVIAAMFDLPAYFKDGKASVQFNHLSMVIDKNNKPLLTTKVQGLSQFYEGLARFEDQDKIGFMNEKGDIKIPATYEVSTERAKQWMIFSEGLSQFEVRIHPSNAPDGSFVSRFGYLNKIGKIVIPATFSYAGPFKNGIAVVMQNGKYGYIKKDGKFLIPPLFANAGYFVDGIARVSGGAGFGDYKYRFIRLN